MLKVMVVDDEQSVKRTLSGLLRREWNHVFEYVGDANNGREALALAEQLHPNLLITDVRMPMMDGFDLVDAIHKMGINLKIVIISGYENFNYAREAIRCGVFEYLLKPLNIDEINATLQRIAEDDQKERERLQSRHQFLVDCKQNAVQMAHMLWVLEVEGARDEWRRLFQRLVLESDRRSSVLRETVLQFLSLFNTEVSQISGGKIQMCSIPDADTDLLEVTLAWLDETAEAIRTFRNWGAHSAIEKVIRHIQQECQKGQISLTDSAEIAGMSPTYFSKYFKEEMGLSYTHYITKLRMEKAMEFLKDPEVKVYEIAYSVGFKEYTYFAKAFKKYFGISATDFRVRFGLRSNTGVKEPDQA